MEHEIPDKPMSANVRNERCVVVCARLADGISADQMSLIRGALHELQVDGWWFVNPGTVIAVVLSSGDGSERSRSCEEALRGLRAAHPSLARIAIASAEGELLCSFGSAGNLESMPLGGAINAALARAIANPG